MKYLALILNILSINVIFKCKCLACVFLASSLKHIFCNCNVGEARDYSGLSIQERDYHCSQCNLQCNIIINWTEYSEIVFSINIALSLIHI